MPGLGEQKGDVWFVYDGECPICMMAADLWRVRDAVGTLHLINARDASDSQLIKEIREKHIDLDKGMVIKFQDTLYHGADALHVMALLGTEHGWFNRLNSRLFKSPAFAKFCYPSMRAARNMALCLKGVKQIRNLDAA